MKLFKNKIKIEDGGIYWGPYGPKYKDTKDPKDIYDYAYYIHPLPNWLTKKYRYWGYHSMYYDGYHHSFGFWYFNISWSF